MGFSDIILYNVMLVVFIGVLFYIGGWLVLGFYLLMNYVGVILGVIIFYVVYNFEDVVWMCCDEWNYICGLLEGMVVFDFGNVFYFLIVNIVFYDLYYFNVNVLCYWFKVCFEMLCYDWNLMMILLS